METLKDIHFQEPLRIYSKDGKLIEEFGSKRRIPITIAQVPQDLINAILATEDQRFFEHPGIDLAGLIRAAILVIKSGEKKQGASTITMQVARNFFLTRKKTYIRKINEILLAIKIDKELSKEKILELYLNKIYFGQGAYGVAAAAMVYYNKELVELDLAQLAMLAGLPQAPSKINPIANPDAALKRRTHVLGRMLDENAISKKRYLEAMSTPITAKYHAKKIEVSAPHAAELIRQILHEQLGDMIYASGYKVYTTIDSNKQEYANQALIQGIEEYDMRHGYRGPLDKQDDFNNINWDNYPSTPKYKVAMVTNVTDEYAEAMLADNSTIQITLDNLKWARKEMNDGKYLGPVITTPSDVVSIGDIIHLRLDNDIWSLTQIPKVEGGLIALDPKSDEILAMVGGYDFNLNRFNHVTQAKRQPGSAMKPFIYASALEKGYTLATKVNDAPIVKKDQSQDNLMWRPQNHNHKFTGITSLREGLKRSKNLVTIRILESIGIDYALKQINKFGFDTSKFPASLSLALGTPNISLMELAAGYAAFANKGLPSKPFLISKIYNAKGKVIFAKPTEKEKSLAISPQVAYLINSVLKDIVQSGRTGSLTKQYINRTDVAGKTGTTNSHKDTWYAGFNPELVAISWLGYDSPKSIHEYGWRSAFPIWLYFMRDALQGSPEQEMPEPSNLVRVRIDPQSGLLATSEQPDSYFEIFRQDTAPTTYADNKYAASQTSTDYLF